MDKQVFSDDVHFFLQLAPALVVALIVLGCLLSVAAGIVHAVTRSLLGYHALPDAELRVRKV